MEVFTPLSLVDSLVVRDESVKRFLISRISSTRVTRVVRSVATCVAIAGTEGSIVGMRRFLFVTVKPLLMS